MKRLLAALGLAVVLPFAAANAQTHDPMRGFARLDQNADGRVTIEEYKTVSQKWMERMIARHPDGRLAKASVEERDAMMTRRFERLDKNRDGVVDAAEWAARPHHGHHHRRGDAQNL